MMRAILRKVCIRGCFINKIGLPTYEAKGVGLGAVKDAKGKWNESIVITA
jgi:hypothetical protein